MIRESIRLLPLISTLLFASFLRSKDLRQIGGTYWDRRGTPKKGTGRILGVSNNLTCPHFSVVVNLTVRRDALVTAAGEHGLLAKEGARIQGTGQIFEEGGNRRRRIQARSPSPRPRREEVSPDGTTEFCRTSGRSAGPPEFIPRAAQAGKPRGAADYVTRDLTPVPLHLACPHFPSRVYSTLCAAREFARCRGLGHSGPDPCSPSFDLSLFSASKHQRKGQVEYWVSATI